MMESWEMVHKGGRKAKAKNETGEMSSVWGKFLVSIFPESVVSYQMILWVTSLIKYCIYPLIFLLTIRCWLELCLNKVSLT